MWESKHSYKIAGVTGRAIFSDTSGIYFLRDNRGVIYNIDQEKAASFRAAEESLSPGAPGRPSLFPGLPVEARMITLPLDYWRYITGNPSIFIGGLIERSIRENRT